jgi:hypothetical protein
MFLSLFGFLTWPSLIAHREKSFLAVHFFFLSRLRGESFRKSERAGRSCFGLDAAAADMFAD